VQENTDKQTQYKSEKVNNLKYSKTKLPWFSCLLQHWARKRGGLILQRRRTHTGRDNTLPSRRLRPHCTPRSLDPPAAVPATTHIETPPGLKKIPNNKTQSMKLSADFNAIRRF